jgi:hypothetical protein
VSERIAQMVDYFHKGNKSAFAKAVGISNQSLGEIVGARQSAPSFAALQKMLTAFPEVRMEWLVMGKGEMLPPKPNEWVDPFVIDSTQKHGFFPPGFTEEHTKREKRRLEKEYAEYYAALEQQKQTREAVRALIEYLAENDPSIRGLLTLLPSTFEAIQDPDTRQQLEDAEWELRTNEYHADQEAERARQRQEHEQQGDQK